MYNKTRVGLSLTPEESQKLRDIVKATTCRNNAEYFRKILFGRPIRARVYNASLDNMIEEIVCLRRELASLIAHPALSPLEKLRIGTTLTLIQIKIDQIADHVCKSKL